MKERNKPRTADVSLPTSLTDSFIADLLLFLSQDDSFSASYLSEQFLSKFVTLDESESTLRRTRAIDKWLKTESTNSVTNHRIINHDPRVDVYPGVSAKRLLDRTASIIAQVLPWTPSLSLRYCGFSGGASTSRTRVQGHPALKFLGEADITRIAYPVFLDMIRGTEWEAICGGLETRHVRSNVLFTVPKNSLIDRVACKEPDLNMFLQKSLGTQIRHSLKRVGINLNDQSVNAELARIGSITNSLMTIDLSSASDSVSIELVRRLLPPDWFYYLDLFRSHYTNVDGVEIKTEMFSSMGNGFTFELESLIFYALTRAVASFDGVRGSISVYGDDIIAPSEIQRNLFSALTFCGFTVNEAKSFWDGPFRESCGSHWYGGVDVKPFFLRKPFSTVSDLILTLNQLINWSSRVIGVVDPRYEDLIVKYSMYVPDHLWGGDDLTSRSSLVTGHSARYELVSVNKPVPQNHVGGLLFWLHSTDGRNEQGSFTTASSRFLHCRARRRNRTSNRDLPLFLNGGVMSKSRPAAA